MFKINLYIFTLLAMISASNANELTNSDVINLNVFNSSKNKPLEGELDVNVVTKKVNGQNIDGTIISRIERHKCTFTNGSCSIPTSIWQLVENDEVSFSNGDNILHEISFPDRSDLGTLVKRNNINVASFYSLLANNVTGDITPNSIAVNDIPLFDKDGNYVGPVQVGLIGDKGDKGDKGDTGATGPAGAKGEDGDPATADNMGNHEVTQDLMLNGFKIRQDRDNSGFIRLRTGSEGSEDMELRSYGRIVGIAPKIYLDGDLTLAKYKNTDLSQLYFDHNGQLSKKSNQSVNLPGAPSTISITKRRGVDGVAEQGWIFYPNDRTFTVNTATSFRLSFDMRGGGCQNHISYTKNMSVYEGSIVRQEWDSDHNDVKLGELKFVQSSIGGGYQRLEDWVHPDTGISYKAIRLEMTAGCPGMTGLYYLYFDDDQHFFNIYAGGAQWHNKYRYISLELFQGY